tara:strand:+ start:183 stop:359 length:177 start_codon:yes stop_codon:yes gene_type:complete
MIEFVPLREKHLELVLTVQELHRSGYVEYIGSHDSYNSENLKKILKYMDLELKGLWET